MALLVHHSISDLYHTLQLPCEEELDFTILSIPDIHHEIPYASPALRAEYFSFILTEDGSGTYYLDENRFPFHSKMLYFTNPGHIKSYEIQVANEGYIIILTEDFLREHVHSDIFDQFPFLLAEIVPPKLLSETKFQEYKALYKQIYDEFERPSIYKNSILAKLFMVLLLKMKEDFWFEYDPKTEGSQNSRIVHAFKQLLDKEFKKMVSDPFRDRRPQVKDFANQLHLHPNYLNAVIRSKTGKTINDWLTARTLSTARSLLRNTAFSAKEIAHKLGFSEPTHFNRFFKKHTNTTPTEYRKRQAALK